MTQQQSIAMTPIGIAHTDVADEDVPHMRREIVSRIRVFEPFVEGLAGIDAYSHLFVLFWMDRAGAPTSLQSHPRGDPALPLTGAFAARGRNHPNSIGLAVVELLGRTGSELTVRRLDAYDNTPILDIKPYDDYDVFPDIEVPAWFRRRAMAGSKDSG
jgi:tRNA (adenine37-N6)-methyltransferase